MCASSTPAKFQGSFQAGNGSSCLLGAPPTPASRPRQSQGAGRRAPAEHPSAAARLSPRCFRHCTWGVAERWPQGAESWVTVNLTRRPVPHALVSLEGCVCFPPAAERAGCVLATEVAAAPMSRKRLESCCRPFAVTRTSTRAGRAGALVFASRNVSISLCPQWQPWDSHTCLGRFHGMREAALSFPMTWPQPGQSRQRLGPHGSKASTSVLWPQKQLEQPFCRALELSESPRGKLLGSDRVCGGEARCNLELLICPPHL